jgi:DNA repair exonuclease SbcCD nuclease subunit
VAGCSFTASGQAAGLPVEGFPGSPDDLPILGVAHCDLDAAESRYAPVSRHVLAATGAAGWFLGHIHAPSLENGTRPIGYLGSLVALDPTETGRRGPWWVEVAPSGALELTHVSLAPLRWEHLEVELDEGLAAEDLFNHLAQAIREHHEAHEVELAEVRVLGFRLRLTGPVRQPATVRAELEGITREPRVIPLGDRVAFLDRIVDDTRPALDLAEFGRNLDPTGLLARDLADLEANGERAAELINRAKQRLAEVAGRNPFLQAGDWDQTEEAIRVRLLRAGRRALVELLAQPGAEETRA